ncbi:hypothetical protein EES43_30035 [Streptomyces sp. ADI96-02]|nr:hypothetical protein EES43_30035 [Streptomyces sp. ADI96-02]
MIKVRTLFQRWISIQERYLLGYGPDPIGFAHTEVIHACSLGPDCVLAEHH